MSFCFYWNLMSAINARSWFIVRARGVFYSPDGLCLACTRGNDERVIVVVAYVVVDWYKFPIFFLLNRYNFGDRIGYLVFDSRPVDEFVVQHR